MELVRQILLKLEEHPHGFAPRLEVPGFTDEQIGYHAAIMGEAGLLHARPITAHGASSPSALPIYLTWAGYEFLASAKDESTWKKGTSLVMSKAGAIGFDILKAVLMAEIRSKVGLP
jgi:hypothetical protein